MVKINDPSTFLANIRLKKTEASISSSLAKISSGKRINKAADDASGMIIADKLESQFRGINQSIRNANDTIAMNQIADGALGEVTNILQDMRVKALQAANASNGEQSRQALQTDVNGSLESLRGILESTSFNGIKLLDSNFINNSFSTGASEPGSAPAAANNINILTNLTLANQATTTFDSVVAEGSLLKAGTTMQAGSSLGVDLSGAEIGGDITTTQQSTLAAGTTLGEGTILAAGSELGGDVTVGADLTTTAPTTLQSGTLLKSGSTLAANTEVTTAFSAGGFDYAVGDVLAGDVTLESDLTLTDTVSLATGSTLVEDSVVEAGSTVGADLTTKGTTTLASETILASGSVIADTAQTNIVEGSEVGGAITLATDVEVTGETTLTAGSTLAAQSQLASGSTVGGTFTSANIVTLTNETTLAAGSTLAEGTEIAAGTVLNNDIRAFGGQVFRAGETLDQNITTQGTNYLAKSQTLATGSIITNNSVLAAAPVVVEGEVGVGSQGGQATEGQASLANIDLTTEAGAQDAVAVIDAALQNINSLRSDFGSRQNQAVSEINNLRNALVNVASAQSSILDVDLAEEVMLLKQTEILQKVGVFAQAQTGNINKNNILDLLQG